MDSQRGREAAQGGWPQGVPSQSIPGLGSHQQHTRSPGSYLPATAHPNHGAAPGNHGAVPGNHSAAPGLHNAGDVPMYHRPAPANNTPHMNRSNPLPGAPSTSPVPSSFPGATISRSIAPNTGGVPGLGPRPSMPLQNGPRPVAMPQGPRLVMYQQPAPMARPNLAAPGSTPARPALSTPPVKCVWTQHKAPDGRFYYYNTKTQQSVWSKPKELEEAQKEAARAAAAAKAAASAPPPATDPIAACHWKEFTAPDKRKYYYNRMTKQSVWTVPPELVAAQQASAALKASPAPAAQPAAADAASATVAPAVSAPVMKPDPEVAPVAQAIPATASPQADASGKFMYATKEDAKNAFKALLSDAKISVDAKWDKVLKQVELMGDKRFAALKSNGERASCHKEWVVEERDHLRAVAKREQDAAKSKFVELLTSKQSMLPRGARFSKCEALCCDDNRWELLPADVRMDTFKQWMEEREVAAAAEEHAARNARVAAFKELLENTSGLKASTTWRKIEEQLGDEPSFKELEGSHKLEVWDVKLRDLVAREDTERQRALLVRRRPERKNRDAFKTLLARNRDAGSITVKTRWKELRDFIRKEAEYLAIENNSTGSRPKELFLDCLADMEAIYDRDKARMKDALAAQNFVFASDTTFSEMTNALLIEEDEDPKLKELAPASKQTYYQELQGRAREREAERDVEDGRRRKTARRDFMSALKHKHVSSDETWDDVRVLMAREPSFRDMPSEEDARDAFVEYIKARKDKRSTRDKKDRKDSHRDGGRRGDRDPKRKHRSDDESDRDARDKRHRKSQDRKGGARGEEASRVREERAERSERRDNQRDSPVRDDPHSAPPSLPKSSLSPPTEAVGMEGVTPPPSRLPSPPPRHRKGSPYDAGSFEEGEV